MANAPIRRQREASGPRLWEWLEGGLPGMRLFDTDRMVRVEEYVKDNRYVVRAELPGVDPGKDVEITVGDGMLHVHGERHEEHREGQRTEFYYGAFSRDMTLPTGADENDVVATYQDGILEITIGLGEQKPPTRRVTVERST